MHEVSHQRAIRDYRQEHKLDADMFGEWYLDIDTSLSNAEIRRIDYKTAERMILDYEWIGTMPLPKSCRFIFGIFFDGCLGGVEVFVHPSTRQFNELHPRNVVQLNRGACAYWTEKNTASYFLAKCLDELRAEGVIAVIAYCTREAGEYGTIYQACGFDYVGETAPSKVYFLDGYWMSERSLADKKKWAEGRSEEWQKKFSGLSHEKLKGKYRYIKTIGSHKQNKEFMKVYEYQKHPYPKSGKSRETINFPVDRVGQFHVSAPKDESL